MESIYSVMSSRKRKAARHLCRAANGSGLNCLNDLFAGPEDLSLFSFQRVASRFLLRKRSIQVDRVCRLKDVLSAFQFFGGCRLERFQLFIQSVYLDLHSCFLFSLHQKNDNQKQYNCCEDNHHDTMHDLSSFTEYVIKRHREAFSATPAW